VNFTLKDGAFTGLIGPNGSGKTTLLKTVYRFYAPAGGAVYLDGADLQTLKPKVAAQKMAVLAQEQAVAFDFPVMELLLMARYAHQSGFGGHTGQDRAVCLDALERFGLSSMRDRNFLSLSGGEKQRLLLAAVFAQETPLIILDEPANHLDIGQQFLVMEAVAQRPMTTVFASIHDLNLAARYCDEIIALKNGRILAQGPVEAILTVPLIRELFQVDSVIDREAETGLLHIRHLPWRHSS
jgi:iron complex transport system ATP-binding protein